MVNILMVIEADLDCIFDAFISKQTFFQIEDDPRLDVIDPDWNEALLYQAEINFGAACHAIA